MKAMTARPKRITELSRIKQSVAVRRGTHTRAVKGGKTVNNGRSPRLLVGVKNILVPTYFSERSLEALAYAENIADPTEAKLTLIARCW